MLNIKFNIKKNIKFIIIFNSKIIMDKKVLLIQKFEILIKKSKSYIVLQFIIYMKKIIKKICLLYHISILILK